MDRFHKEGLRDLLGGFCPINSKANTENGQNTSSASALVKSSVSAPFLEPLLCARPYEESWQ